MARSIEQKGCPSMNVTTTAFIIAAIALPFVGALHAFCSSMGYHYLTPQHSWGVAWRVGAMLAAVSVSIVAVRMWGSWD